MNTLLPNSLDEEQENLKNQLKEFLRRTSIFFRENDIEKIAKETQFVKRESKLTGHLFLSIFVFGVNIYGNPTLEQLIGFLKLYLTDFTITRQSLHERINEEAVEFFKKILDLSINLVVPEALKLQELNQFPRILIWDSTKFQLPAALASYFPGTGGSASPAGVKIQFCYDLKAHQWLYTIESAIDSDNAMDSDIIGQTGPGELSVHDLGYFKIELFDGLYSKGAYYLSRLKTNANIYIPNLDGSFNSIDLADLLRSRQFRDRIELTVFIRSKHNVFTKTRLVIEKLPEPAVNQRRRKLHKQARSRGKTPSARSIFLASFNFYITNANCELLPASCCRILYSIRWQIELIFKAWKSHLKVDKVLVKHRPERVLTTLIAKLIFITITAKIIRLTTALHWILSCREISYFRALRHFQTIAEKWFFLIIHSYIASIFALLEHAVSFIQDNCFKIPQKDRVYPLQILKNIDLMT